MKNNGLYRLLFTKPCQLRAFYDLSKKYKFNIDRIYLDFDMLSQNAPELMAICSKLSKSMPELSWFLSLPAVLRQEDMLYLKSIKLFLSENPMFQGILCGNLEGIGFFMENPEQITILADHNFYLWNQESVSAWNGKIKGGCLPLELNSGEQRELIKAENGFSWDKILYGYLPMMFTANCVAKTSERCRKGNSDVSNDVIMLKDRTGMDFPVLLNCKHCFNTIFNSVPLFLRVPPEKWQDNVAFRLQFTIEEEAMTREILTYFLTSSDLNAPIPIKAYTTGHEKRGVT